MSYVKVEGHDNLVRDENGVILNTNSDEIKAARARKKARIKKDREFDDLKQEVSDLKGMMKQILEKL